MTRGNPGGLLVRFALPLILSSMLQQLYTLFDSVIVGRLLGLQGLYLMDAAAWVPVAAFLGLCYHRLLKQRRSALPQP